MGKKITAAEKPRRKYIVTFLRDDLTNAQLDEAVVEHLRSAGLAGLSVTAYEPATNTFTKLHGH